MVTFSIVVYKEEGVYIAKCLEVGTASQGKTINDAISNLKEATELYLEEFQLKKCENALFTTFEVREHAKVKEEEFAKYL